MGFLDRLLGRKRDVTAEGLRTAPPPATMPDETMAPDEPGTVPASPPSPETMAPGDEPETATISGAPETMRPEPPHEHGEEEEEEGEEGSTEGGGF